MILSDREILMAVERGVIGIEATTPGALLLKIVESGRTCEAGFLGGHLGRKSRNVSPARASGTMMTMDTQRRVGSLAIRIAV